MAGIASPRFAKLGVSNLATFYERTQRTVEIYIYILEREGVILLKTGQNCDIEGKNSKCEFFYAIIWE